MKLVDLRPSELVTTDELTRSGSAKQFEERLKASIEEIGLAEPLKVAPLPSGKYLVVDGNLRLRAIKALRKSNRKLFSSVPAYITDLDKRFEIRYQTDIYQDLLPSQLAALVEHLHKAERVRKADIARYIGVSPATLRNYTGLWRLLQRGGLFAQIVDLMDVGVIPSSNPFAWLRLIPEGVQKVLEQSYSEGGDPATWIQERITAARLGNVVRFTTEYVETTTDGLEARYYREDQDLRSVKRDLGTRRGRRGQGSKPSQAAKAVRDTTTAVSHLHRVVAESRNPVLQTAAGSLKVYLQ